MITVQEGSLAMMVIVEAVKESMRLQSCILPTLFVLNRGSSIIIDDDTTDSLIYEIDHNPNPVINDIFITSVSFTMDKVEDEDQIFEHINKLVSRYQPEAVAFVVQCRFKDIEINSGYKKGMVLKDPTSLRAIQFALYTRHQKMGFSKRIPFIEGSNKSSAFEEEFNNVSFIDYPWYPMVGEHQVSLGNPFFD